MPKPVSQELKKQICDTIASLIKEHGIKNKFLAEKVGITPEAVSRIKTGEMVPGHDSLIRIADFFKVSTDYIYGLKN